MDTVHVNIAPAKADTPPKTVNILPNVFNLGISPKAYNIINTIISPTPITNEIRISSCMLKRIEYIILKIFGLVTLHTYGQESKDEGGRIHPPKLVAATEGDGVCVLLFLQQYNIMYINKPIIATSIITCILSYVISETMCTSPLFKKSCKIQTN